MHTFRLRIVLMVLMLALAVPASLQAVPTKVDATFSRVALGPSVDVLEDPGGQMDLEAVRASSGFKPAPKVGTNFGFTRSAWWVRFTVANAGDVRAALNAAKQSGKNSVLMRVKTADATRFVAVPLVKG